MLLHLSPLMSCTAGRQFVQEHAAKLAKLLRLRVVACDAACDLPDSQWAQQQRPGRRGRRGQPTGPTEQWAPHRPPVARARNGALRPGTVAPVLARLLLYGVIPTSRVLLIIELQAKLVPTAVSVSAKASGRRLRARSDAEHRQSTHPDATARGAQHTTQQRGNPDPHPPWPPWQGSLHLTDDLTGDLTDDLLNDLIVTYKVMTCESRRAPADAAISAVELVAPLITPNPSSSSSDRALHTHGPATTGTAAAMVAGASAPSRRAAKYEDTSHARHKLEHSCESFSWSSSSPNQGTVRGNRGAPAPAPALRDACAQFAMLPHHGMPALPMKLATAESMVCLNGPLYDFLISTVLRGIHSLHDHDHDHDVRHRKSSVESARLSLAALSTASCLTGHVVDLLDDIIHRFPSGPDGAHSSLGRRYGQYSSSSLQHSTRL